eukprot:gene7127-12782_t
MDKIENGWFLEKNKQWPGQVFGLEVEEVLYSGKSQYQDILVFKSKTYGNVLVLDGVIQCTDKDECAYQEMISLLPLNAHPNPKKVLIIGGGDGGVAREVVKHPCVESVTQCEIDEDVINAARKYLPNLAMGFDSPKMNLHVGDGFEFMKNHQSEFDVIIADTSDPEGPAESLFTDEFYKLMNNALKPDGLLCTQGECMWIHLKLIKEMKTFCRRLFPVSSYGAISIPSYPCGTIGFMMCSKNIETNFKEPLRIFTEEEKEKMKLRYYDEDVHRSAFVLPRFVKKKEDVAQKEREWAVTRICIYYFMSDDYFKETI